MIDILVLHLGSFLLFRRAWKDPGIRKALLVGCSLQLFQQLIGINTGGEACSSLSYSTPVIYYSARILMMSGISNDMGLILWLSAAVSGVNFLSSFLGKRLPYLTYAPDPQEWPSSTGWAAGS